MEIENVTIATLLFLGMTAFAMCDDANQPAQPKGEKPQAAPGWVVVEESGR